jgi:hypothetical protein
VDPAQIVALLRARALRLTTQDLELDASASADPWGLVMEIGYPDEVVTLVVLTDGSVSVYLRSGKGRIGCGLHPKVRALTERTLQLARTVMPAETSKPPFSLPNEGEVRFYFHTSNGVHTSAASRAQLEDGEVALTELYSSAHAVIGMVELTGAGQPIADAIADAAASVESQATSTLSANSTGGKPCRILPYVGNVAHRSRR